MPDVTRRLDAAAPARATLVKLRFFARLTVPEAPPWWSP